MILYLPRLCRLHANYSASAVYLHTKRDVMFANIQLHLFSADRSWCMDLLLDVMSGVRAWDDPRDREEWWGIDPDTNFAPDRDFKAACTVGGYLLNGVGSELLNHFCRYDFCDVGLNKKRDFHLRTLLARAHTRTSVCPHGTTQRADVSDLQCHGGR